MSTGFDWIYDARLHTGATAWFVFAELGYNPYWNVDTSEPVPPLLYGDLDSDGDITPADAAIVLRMAVRGEYTTTADVSRDRQVNALDALMIMQAAAGAISL